MFALVRLCFNTGTLFLKDISWRSITNENREQRLWLAIGQLCDCTNLRKQADVFILSMTPQVILLRSNSVLPLEL